MRLKGTGKDIVVVDAGTGNLQSVLNALNRLGCNPVVSGDPERVLGCAKMVLPGVGAYRGFMDGLRKRSLEEAVKAFVAAGRPVLGICVGMQAVFGESEEMGSTPGLGVLEGKVIRFSPSMGVKVPHNGWNQLDFEPGCPLLDGLERGAFVLFNHSYYCVPEDRNVVKAVTDYGIKFTSVVQKGLCFGVQFHPEKSQKAGLKILSNFLRVKG